MEEENGSRKEKAAALFRQGYNCAQSVFAAYSDLYGIDMGTALKIASSFGAGMGRMREVCGAVSGMFMLAGLATGTDDPRNTEGKKRNYDMVQRLAAEYKKTNGSIICRELLGAARNAEAGTGTTPEPRTEEYYKKRPCICLVEDAADIIERVLLNGEKTKE